MQEQIFYCPHCGQPIPPTDPPDDPGIIRDFEAGEAQSFSLIQITDLTGDPFHDWPLIMARFQNTLPWLVEVILSDPTTARYVKGYKAAESPPAQSGPSQLWLDLDTVRPHLSKIVQRGEFTYGHQSRIAEALGVPNQGNYRRRIQNVVSALERTLIRNSNSSNTANAPRTAISTEKKRSVAA